MLNIIKWTIILCGVLIAAALTVVFIIPKFIDAQKFRPKIESMVSEATGRNFKLGGDLRFSLFPLASIVVGDAHIENSPGFEEKNIAQVESFEIQVEFMPLVLSLFKVIHVKRLILKGARIVLEIDKDGRTNWVGIGKVPTEASHESSKGKGKLHGSESDEGHTLRSISIEQLAISDSSIVWIDHSKGKRFQISDLNMRLQDIYPDRPIHFFLSAQVEDQPLSLAGNLGPLGVDFGRGTVPVDITLDALELLEVKLKGNVTGAVSSPRFDLSVDVPLFSPRELIAAIAKDFPLITEDPNALTRVAVKADLKGEASNMKVSEGVLNIDDSRLDFSFKAGDFFKPDVKFEMRLDRIDLEQYLPPKSEKKAEKENSKTGTPPSMQKKTDYAPLRRLILDGTMLIKKLKVGNARIQDMFLKVTAKNGVFKFEPFNLKLYQGDAEIFGTLDVKQDEPENSLRLQAKGIDIGPFLRDVMEKDIMEGKLNTDLTLRISGNDFQSIKKSMIGKGNVLIEDGAIKGIDLEAMVRNTDGAYGFGDKGEKPAQTAFSEFQVPFIVKNGVFYTDKTRIVSNLIRAQTTGNANLISEKLDFRTEATFVTTRKTNEDEMKRSEVMVPILITGSFSAPEFRPDLRGIAQQKLEEKVFESSKFKEIFEKEDLKPFEEDVKDLLKGILDIPLSEDKQ